MSEAVVEARGLTLQRGVRTLVASLDFALYAGEILHVRGPNGCGKSTLLECVAGVRSEDDGELRTVPLNESLWLGHRSGFAPELSARDNLSVWCALHDGQRDAIPDAMRHWSVPQSRLRGFGALSAGQQQRTALATLHLKPALRLWILDEPAASLDISAVPLLAQSLAAFAQGGGAVLLSTHQPIGDVVTRQLDLGA